MSCLIKNHSRVGKKIRVRQVLETLFALLPKQGQVWVKIIKWALIFWRFWKTPTSFDSFFAKWWNFKVTRLLLITVFQIYLLNAIKRCICIKNSSKHNWFPKIGSNFEPNYFSELIFDYEKMNLYWKNIKEVLYLQATYTFLWIYWIWDNHQIYINFGTEDSILPKSL